jgi:hypothetical protein
MNAVAPKGLNEVKSLAAQFMKDRQQHLTAAQEIERDLLGLRDQLDGILGVKDVKATVTAPTTAPAKRGRPLGSRSKRTSRSTAVAKRDTRSRGRKGGLSGTQKIEAILEKAPNHRMSSGELAREAEKQGVANPHSSYQSLKRRNRIELKDGFVNLVAV